MVKGPGLGWTSEKTAGVGWAMQTSWLLWEGGMGHADKLAAVGSG